MAALLTEVERFFDMLRHSVVEDVTASKVVCAGRGYLLGVTYIPAANADSAYIRDGVTVVDNIIDGHVTSVVTAFNRPFPNPVPFTKGLYIEVNATMAHVLVHWVMEEALPNKD
jgi:hypothetical protein